MPLFEYECRIGHTSEIYAGVGAAPKLIACPTCAASGERVRAKRILSATPTTFKQNDRKAIKTPRS